ncbi:MAG TPA: hypothetical protein PLC11_02790 [bacterium]|jgi:hypothetical protein|nr:hypothetical protein [bacterium]HOR69599.1 hypothetical protein [bacterium]HPL83744.1 hypothetical protein [bacterium]
MKKFFFIPLLAVVLLGAGCASKKAVSPANEANGNINIQSDVQEDNGPIIQLEEPAGDSESGEWGTVSVCTTETKTCPDGSVVGRELPDCQFAPCPGE